LKLFVNQTFIKAIILYFAYFTDENSIIDYENVALVKIPE
jgi:hypothetical protein